MEARADARARKDWAQADAVRDRLNASGIVLEDTARRCPLEAGGDMTGLDGHDAASARSAASRRAARAVAPPSRARTARARPSAPAGSDKQRLQGRGPDAAGRGAHQAPGRAQGARPPRAAAASGGANPAARQRRSTARAGPRGPRRAGGGDAPETVVGRNPVVEALRAKVPATALYVALGVDADERVTEAVALAGKARLALMEISRAELDRMTGRALHQGLALQVPPYTYLHPDDLLRAGAGRTAPRCWSRSTASPTRATSARSCGRPRPSARRACSCPSAARPA